MNSFNQPLSQFQANCNAYQSSGQVYGTGGQPAQSQSPQITSPTVSNSSLAAMQAQFASQSAAAANFVTFQPNYNNSAAVNCLQKEIESLKKQNSELQSEVDKLRAAYTDCNYQLMTSNMKLGNCQEQFEQLHKEKAEQDKAYKDLKVKYDEKFALFRSPHQSDERSLFCDECNFEVKSQVALFIHKLNHHLESSFPRHLQLSTRSFSTMPDDSISFRYKCHCCEIDCQREFARHEIYVHIYQFHTFDIPFKCKFCFLYFTSKSYLNDHLIEKHSMPNRQGKNKRKGAPVNNMNANSGNANNVNGPDRPEQLNSTLQLNPRTSLEVNNSNAKRSKNQQQNQQHQNHLSDAESAADINELFQQLVGETLGSDHHHHSGGHPHNASQHHDQPHQHQQQHQMQQQNAQQNHNHNLQSTSSSSESPKNASSTEPLKSTSTNSSACTLLSQQRDNENLQQIMNDLDDDDNLNCKYPGCKFVATTKNHLKFHISAHLMSKYKCPYCTFVGNRIVEIKRHILKSPKHTDQHVFLCPDCDFASDCEKTFRDHYSRYHNATVDLSLVIERMFLNESNKVGQSMMSAFKAT